MVLSLAYVNKEFFLKLSSYKRIFYSLNILFSSLTFIWKFIFDYCVLYPVKIISFSFSSSSQRDFSILYWAEIVYKLFYKSSHSKRRASANLFNYCYLLVDSVSCFSAFSSKFLLSSSYLFSSLFSFEA